MSKEYFPDFTKEDYRLIIDALEKRKTSYIAGDKMYRDYENLIKEMERRSSAAIPWKC